MRLKYLKLKHWFIAVAAAALGMNVSCEMPCEYGTPEATYHVKGSVTAPDGTPVPGIEVSQNWSPESSYRQPCDTTDEQGNFNTTFYKVCLDAIRLTFSDIDSTENGSYCDTSLNIPTRDIPLSGGDGHWYMGEGNVNVNVTLTPKS